MRVWPPRSDPEYRASPADTMTSGKVKRPRPRRFPGHLLHEIDDGPRDCPRAKIATGAQSGRAGIHLTSQEWNLDEQRHGLSCAFGRRIDAWFFLPPNATPPN